MKSAHFVMKNGSGMHRVAESISIAEQALGLDSMLVDVQDATTWDAANDADIYVVHTHLPDRFLYSGKKVVYVGHGTPENVIDSTYESACLPNRQYGHGDGFMLAQFWLQHADATVTFWPRHQAIWQSLCDKNTRVDRVNLGVDKTVWFPGNSAGKFVGEPSVLTAENAHRIKWPLDLIFAWPWVVQHPRLHGARLHAIYLPRDQHLLWFPLVNRNGTSFAGYISDAVFSPPQLRNAFASVDFYCGLVRYGDYNLTCLQAQASGCAVISYRGNLYADYWVTEGDQRVIAEELAGIFTHETKSREVTPVPDISQTAQEMKTIYERL